MRITAEFESLAEFQAFLEERGIEPPKSKVYTAEVTLDPESAAELKKLVEPPERMAYSAEATTGPIPAAPKEPEPETAEPPAPEERTYTLDEIQKAGAQLLSKNKSLKGAVKKLFQTYGIEVLSELIPAQYAAFANDLRELGATI